MPGFLLIGSIFQELKLVVLVEAEGISVGIEEGSGLNRRFAGALLEIEPAGFGSISGKVFKRLFVFPKVLGFKLALRYSGKNTPPSQTVCQEAG
jgi:hypothetical protein